MSLFDKIKHAIFGDKGPLGGQFSGHAQPAPAAPAAHPAPAPAAPKPAAAAQPAPPPAAAAVDVEKILSDRAAARGKPSNWRESIVDLLILLDLDSSLTARKELAQELNVHAAADGTAEQNVALHKAVMRKLAENGGNVPASLRD